MPHPRSPRMAASTELAGGMGTDQPPMDVFRAPSPPRTQDSYSSTSPIPSVEVPPTATAIQEPAPQDQDTAPAAMHLEGLESMQWAAQHPFPIGHARQTGADYPVSVPFTRNPGDFYHYAQNGMSYNDNSYSLTYSSQYPPSSCPRSYNEVGLTGLPHDVHMSYPPAAYQIEPVKHHDLSAMSDPGMNDHLMQLSDEYEHHYGAHIKQESHSGYQSPYSDMTRASTPDEPPRYSHESYGPEEGVVDKEQPYAQLIYQALLGAEGHTMILRDIYEWFKKHTDKASASETKGWQNSIRHNLSMNGAFEKVDQPNEDSRKGFMWRLTPSALIEGVKSTTRYRSKQPTKRGHRQPQPQRQASGAKGGHASRRSATLRRSRHCARSVPAAFDPSSYPPAPPSPSYYGSDVDFGGYVAAGGRVEGGGAMFGGYSEAAYVLEQSPGDSLFTNSPSPSALDEPRTPVSQGWEGEVMGGGFEVELGLGSPYGCEEGLAYQEYVG